LNGTDIPGATNQTFEATVSGNYTVRVENAGGCLGTSAPYTHIVQPCTPPVPTISVNGNTLTATAGFVSYHWALNGINIPGATNQTYETTQSGNYTVTVTDGNNCNGISGVYSHVFIPCPTIVPTISPNGNTLTATAGFVSYQWTLNGTDIPGATNQTYEATVSGNYTVTVTDGSACTGISAVFSHTYLGLEDIAAQSVKIYPNPTNGMVYITSDVSVNVTVIAMEGKIILLSNNAKTIDLSHVSAGVYMVKISDENGDFVKMERIVVEK
jgi:hypothetical protein